MLPHIEPIQAFIAVLVSCKKKEDPMKNGRARVLTRFPHYNPMGAICYILTFMFMFYKLRALFNQNLLR